MHKLSNSLSKSSSISTARIEYIVEKLRREQHRDSTHQNYYCMWHNFNQFFVQLDVKPNNLEDRIMLYAAFLIDNNKKDTTVKSYVSAIKAVLAEADVEIHEDRCLVKLLTRACRLKNQVVRIRLPIQKDLLNVLLKYTENFFRERGQPYLMQLYMMLFAVTYYRLFRIGEVTQSEHVVTVTDVHIADNKRKMLFVLRSSKTHCNRTPPQTIKISSNRKNLRKTMTADLTIHGRNEIWNYCPYMLLRDYLAKRQKYQNVHEQFFVFSDRSAVQSQHFRQTLKVILQLAGFDHRLYSTHSLRSGRSLDLMKLGFSVETIKKMGRWKSNSVYRYLR